MGRRGLRVVDVAHPSSLVHQHDPVGETAEGQQRGPDARGGRAAVQRRGRRGQPVGDVVGIGPGQLVDGAEDDTVLGHQVAADHSVPGVGPGAEAHLPPGCPGQVPGHHRIVSVAHRDLVGALVPPDPGLGALVVQQRAVVVEVVGREVQPGPHGRCEALRVVEPERRRLHHEDVDGRVVDRGHQRDGRVADRAGGQARGLEHRAHQRRHRRLAVGTGDGQQRPVVPPCRQVELRQDRHARRPGQLEHRMAVGQAGRGHHRVHRAHQIGQARRIRGHHQVDAQLGEGGAGGVARAVVGGGHRFVALRQRLHDGQAGDAQAEDQHPHQSRAPVETKSA
jgi:hypothetical protein